MSSVTIKSEIDKLTFGITDEIERQRIIGNYFREKTARLKHSFAVLSDDELDNVVGGLIIGDIYDERCEELEAACKSLTIGGGIDVCSFC